MKHSILYCTVRLCSQNRDRSQTLIRARFLLHLPTVLYAMHRYTGIMASARPLGRRIIGVESDSEGMLATALDTLCQQLHSPAGPTPRVVYLTPTGSNPTGVTISAQRRHDIYGVCCKHNLFIIEDDPYIYLRMPDRIEADLSVDDMPGMAIVEPSFLSLDVQGRVVRLDSFSKIFAPAARTGWITARRELLDKMVMAAEVLTWALSALTQTVVWQMLREWGEAGLEAHVRKLQLT